MNKATFTRERITAKNGANIFASWGEGFSFSKRLSIVNKILMGNAMPTKPANLQTLRYPISTDGQDKPKFPSPRYFQIHFEHLESQLAETRQSLQAMQSQMADLTILLSLIVPESTKSKNSK